MAQFSVNQNIVLNSTLGSGDIVVKDRHLFIQGQAFFKFDDVELGSIVKETAITSETLGVVTFTVASATPAYNTQYSLALTIQPTSTATGTATVPITRVISIATPATGTLTPTTVDAQFIAAINAALGSYVLATGTTTLIVTALAGYPILTGGWVVNPDSSTVAQTTQGIAKRGTAAALQALGVPSALTTAAAYTLYSCITDTGLAGFNNTARVNQRTPKMLWLSESMTNVASFISRFDQAILAYTGISGTTVDHSVIDVGE